MATTDQTGENAPMRQIAERRWNFRKPLRTAVILHSPRIGVLHTHTRDISYGGVQLETRHANLDPDCQTRISFVVRKGAETLYHSLDGRLVHRGLHGSGVMFVDFDRDTFLLLHTLMFATQSIPDGQQGPLAA